MADCNWPILKDLTIEYLKHNYKQCHDAHWIIKLMVPNLLELCPSAPMIEINHT